MLDFGPLGYISFDWQFLVAVFSIILIDLVLAGDNAVVIAMAVKNLTGKTRRLGIFMGAGGAVLVRVACTFAVAQLLNIQFIKLIGGAVLIWIGIKLLTEGAEECKERECTSLWQAVWIIVIADISMGIDNMLAVGAASHGNLFLLIFGLVLSIPFVVLMSDLLARIMDRYPIIVWVGAALIGKVGGEMMITDPWVHSLLGPPKWVEYAVTAFFVLVVVAVGKIIINRNKLAEPSGQKTATTR